MVPDYFAVRTSVCAAGKRDGVIDATRVKKWKEMLAGVKGESNPQPLPPRRKGGGRAAQLPFLFRDWFCPTPPSLPLREGGLGSRCRQNDRSFLALLIDALEPHAPAVSRVRMACPTLRKKPTNRPRRAKVRERAFVMEFYHEFRRLWDQADPVRAALVTS